MENTMNLTGYAMPSSPALVPSRGRTFGFGGAQGHVAVIAAPVTDRIDATAGTPAWGPPT